RFVERKRYFFTELQNPVFMTATGLFICALLVLGAVAFGAEDSSWTGIFILFVVCLYRLMGPGTRLITAQAQISMNMHAFEAIDDFIKQAKASRLPDGEATFTHLENTIGFNDVRVVYDEERGPALDGVSFEIKNREMVALVGPSGSGKSTLVSLIMRLRDPDDGQVTLDGRDLREFKVASWRERVSAVSQDIVLFNDTVRANIAFGLENISDGQIWAALKFAAADDFVRAMPGGLDEQLGEGGGALSGGQRQRMALARALLSQPDVLVLDEATSHLDTITEAVIQRTIQEVRSKHTVLIVAHRLSTIRHADRIVVMDRGKVVEIGSHDELFSKGGVYRHLFDSQALDLDYEES
ncbi:ABC transporter ATP-binding protein, partial [Pseudomonadota bacterium]